MLLKATETVDVGLELGSNPIIDHEIATDSTGTLNALSTPAVTVPWSDQLTLGGAVDTLDLTALVRGNAALANVDMTGLKVQAVKFHCPSANTGTAKIEKGAANGYAILGASFDVITLSPGESAIFIRNESLPDVSGTVKTIDITSTVASDVLDIILVAG